MRSRLIIAAVGAAFLVNGPALAADNMKSHAQKRLETQRKDLTRNWAGRRITTGQPDSQASSTSGSVKTTK